MTGGVLTTNDCPVCTCPTDGEKAHTDGDCAAALINTGLFATASFFRHPVPPSEAWTDQEREFANELALQCVTWKRAEMEAVQ